MKLDEIKVMWSNDCEIDDIELDKSSLEVPKLHAKYSELLTDNIIVLRSQQMKFNMLRKDKWMWFNGKLDDDRIRELGWAPDPFDGLKVMKSDFGIWFDSDPDLQSLKAKIDYLQETIEFIKRCMDNITWRHQTIKNTIEWRKFMAGQ
jgi:capsule polysaccharide export protein KpsC/LpsZ